MKILTVSAVDIDETRWNLTFDPDDRRLSMGSLKEDSLLDTEMQSFRDDWARKCRHGTFSASVSLWISQKYRPRHIWSPYRAAAEATALERTCTWSVWWRRWRDCIWLMLWQSLQERPWNTAWERGCTWNRNIITKTHLQLYNSTPLTRSSCWSFLQALFALPEHLQSYLNILKSRYIYLRCKITWNMKSCILRNCIKVKEFMLKTRKKIAFSGVRKMILIPFELK